MDLSIERVETYFVPRMEVVVRPEWATAEMPAKPGHLGSIEEFVKSCPADRRATIASIIEDFLRRPGASETHDTQACLALYLTNPANGRPLNIAQLYTDGSFVVCRGYVVDSPVFSDEADRTAFDRRLTEIFGDYRQTSKNYYPNMGQVFAMQAAEYAALVDAFSVKWNEIPH